MEDRGNKPLTTMTILSEGLGGFFSPWGGIWLVVCILLVTSGADSVMYGLQSEPIVVTEENIGSVSHNDYVRLSLPLDFQDGLQFETVGGEAYSLTPVKGTDRRFIVYQSGHFTQDEMLLSNQTYTGRLIGKGWLAGEWDVDAKRIELVEQFQRQQIQVPDDALVLDVGKKPELEVWPIIVAAGGGLCLLYFGLCLVRTIGFFMNRDRLLEHMVKQSEDATAGNDDKQTGHGEDPT